MRMIQFKLFWITAFGNQWIQWNKSKCIFSISGNSKFSIRGKKSWSAGNGLDLKEKFNKNYLIRRIVQRIRHKKMGVIFNTEDVESENESFFDAKYIYKIFNFFEIFVWSWTNRIGHDKYFILIVQWSSYSSIIW